MSRIWIASHAERAEYSIVNATSRESSTYWPMRPRLVAPFGTGRGRSVPVPEDYLTRVEEVAFFDVSDGTPRVIDDAGLDALAAAAKAAQRQLYRTIAGMERRDKINAGAYVYFTFLRPFAELAVRGHQPICAARRGEVLCVPPDAVVSEELANRVEARVREATVERILAGAGIDNLVAAEVDRLKPDLDAVADGLRDRINDELTSHPKRDWRSALDDIVDTVASQSSESDV